MKEERRKSAINLEELIKAEQTIAAVCPPIANCTPEVASEVLTVLRLIPKTSTYYNNTM